MPSPLLSVLLPRLSLIPASTMFISDRAFCPVRAGEDTFKSGWLSLVARKTTAQSVRSSSPPVFATPRNAIVKSGWLSLVERRTHRR
jgi:hypothetical protein